MAKDVTGQPWYFDAAAQGEGFGPNADGVSVVFNKPVFIKRIKVYTGDGGEVLLYDRKDAPAVTGAPGPTDAHFARHTVLDLKTLAAQDNFEVPVEATLLGIYVSILPASAYLEVFHGEVA